VLVALIVVAGLANLNLSVANVALPDIGKHFDSSQTTLDLIAVGYSLGLACSVLWLGALGDRYKLMLGTRCRHQVATVSYPSTPERGAVKCDGARFPDGSCLRVAAEPGAGGSRAETT
jgi:MFS family permease